MVFDNDTRVFIRLVFKRFVKGGKNPMLLLVTTEDEMYEKLYHTRLFWYLSSIHVFTENEVNPKRIFIDFRTIAKTGSYRIGNLEYILPKGMSINRDKHPDLNFPIVKVNPFVSSADSR